MQIIEDLKKVVQRKGYSVAEIARNTGIRQDRIYKWLNGKGRPKHEDAIILEKWLSDIEIVPISKLKEIIDQVLKADPALTVESISENLWADKKFLDNELKQKKASPEVVTMIKQVYTPKDLLNPKKTSITFNELAGIVLRIYALQQVSLSVLAELLADKMGKSVTAIRSELLKAVEAEEAKMRDVL